MIIHPYKQGSRSTKRLKVAINATQNRRIVSVLTRAPRGNRCLIINWGAAEMSYPEGQHWIINSPKDVSAMSDKVKFFERTNHDDSILTWTTNPETAASWGSKVFVRELTRASGGRGIHVWTPESGEPLPSAPLYTRHQQKTHEYRLHMARSLTGCEFEPILIQRKVWKSDDPVAKPASWDVRSHDNGFIFQAYPEDKAKTLPAAIFRVARTAMAKYFSDMHFAALDVLYHKPSDRAVICEGNTAPGLENNTVDVYAHYLLGLEEEFRRERMVVL